MSAEVDIETDILFYFVILFLFSYFNFHILSTSIHVCDAFSKWPLCLWNTLPRN